MDQGCTFRTIKLCEHILFVNVVSVTMKPCFIDRQCHFLMHRTASPKFVNNMCLSLENYTSMLVLEVFCTLLPALCLKDGDNYAVGVLISTLISTAEDCYVLNLITL